MSFDELPDDIVNRLGSQRKATRDLPRIEAEVEEAEAQALATLRKMGRNVPLAEAEAWRVDAASQATIRKLDREISALEAARQKTRDATIEKGARHASLVKRRSEMSPAGRHHHVEEGGLAGRARRSARSAADRASIRSRAACAGRDFAPVDAWARRSLGVRCGWLALPSAGTVDRFARDWATIERAFEHLTEQRSTLARRLVEKKRDIDALELVGKVPTEAIPSPLGRSATKVGARSAKLSRSLLPRDRVPRRPNGTRKFRSTRSKRDRPTRSPIACAERRSA